MVNATAKHTSRLGGDVGRARARPAASVAALTLILGTVGLGSVLWLAQRKVQVSLRRNWSWDRSEFWDVFQEPNGVKVAAPCLWLDAGPVRVRFPLRNVDGAQMATGTRSKTAEAVAHLEQFQLDEAEGLLEEVRLQGFLVLSPTSTLTDYGEASCYVQVAKGSFLKAARRADYLGFYDRKMRKRAELWELAAKSTPASEVRLEAITPSRGADEAFTLAALFLNRGDLEKGRRQLVLASERDPQSELPKVGAIARIWLRKLERDAKSPRR